MDDWTAALAQELGLDTTVDVEAVLNVAREVAHAVDRPAAPVSTYLLGYAVGRGADPRSAAEAVAELAQAWRPAG
ncbi:MAG: hypothetical protein KDC39_09660 [Actinobacteria bacterium]|nr:hypothetical protein [Actinomycetota bacterium]